LTAAFSARAHEVTAATVIAAIRNLRGERRRRRYAVRRLRLALGTRRSVPAVAGVAVVLLTGAAATMAYRNGLSSKASFQLLPSWSAVSMAPVGQSVSSATPAMIPSSTVPGQPPSLAAATEFTRDRLEGLLVQALKLWGVRENLSGQAVAAWPVGSDGTLDVPAIAGQYQLSATLLLDTSVAELRVMDLPAILELIDRSSRRSWLLKRLDDKSAALTSAEGEDSTMSLGDLSSWRGSAWVIWRNVDLLPSDPARALTPVVLTTLGLRLKKLGLLSLPLPTENDWRFQEAVRRFQSSMSLEPDGVVGPRTTLAMSRVLDGRFAPTLAGASPTR